MQRSEVHVTACMNAHGVAWCRINPVDEEGKTRSPEKMSELVHESHQAHTRKALKALKVPHPHPHPATPISCAHHQPAVAMGSLCGCAHVVSMSGHRSFKGLS